MKKHIITPFGMGVRAMALVALCATATGCQDDFTLDDEKPAWLGESVLVALQQRGDFENYLKLMHDLGMDEILSRTGSRTVFAAPDSAFEAFYKNNATLALNNPWRNATSYDKLSPSQKLLLAKCSMLNNAITMETLSCDEASGDKPVTRGAYMRRPTLVDVTDTIQHVPSNELPHSYNEPDEDGKVDPDYWAFYRSNTYNNTVPGSDDGTGRGLYLTSGDGTSNMMLCFTTEHMASNAMVSRDLELVLGETRKPTDVHVYDAKILEQDITCQNGYVELMQKVIAPLPNMAEVIRTNGETNIFSHIMERFALPVYVESYNNAYRNLHDEFPETDTIYTKWYMSEAGMHSLSGYISQNGNSADIVISKDNKYNVVLPAMFKFDPAWNAINANSNSDTRYSDMAAMFVPNDRTMIHALKKGGRLHMLVDTYAKKYLHLVDAADPDRPETFEGLYQAIDQIPMNSIGTFVRNIMFPSFTGSVESKFGTLKNDAGEDIFINGECLVDKVKLACNGAVYITSEVYPPADYSSVAAPAYISLDKKIMKWAIYDGDKGTSGTELMKLNYYAYLKAMSSVFTLFVPDDEALLHYYDPTSFITQVPRYLELKYQSQGASKPPVVSTSYSYDVATGTTGSVIGNTNNPEADDKDVMTRLRDILESHTIVHNDSTELMSQILGGKTKDDFYLTKGGTAIKVVRDASGRVVAVKGGFQIENETREGIDPATAAPGVLQSNVKNATYNSPGGNGDTYILDSPIIPASKSVYKVLEERETSFSDFIALCHKVTDLSEMTDVPKGYLNIDEIISELGLTTNEKGDKNDAQLLRKYQVFVSGNSYPDQNVSFFNNYNYTVYAPTNDAMQAAYNSGLPTWNEIEVEYNDENSWIPAKEAVMGTDEDGNEIEVEPAVERHLNPTIRTKLIAKINYLANFIRLHFQDQSVFADRSSWDTFREYASSCYYTPTGDDADGNFIKLRIYRDGDYKMRVQSLSQKEDGGVGIPVDANYMVNINGADGSACNIMARDIELILSTTGAGPRAGLKSLQTMKYVVLESSNSAVVHSIDKVLLLPASEDFNMKGYFPDFNDPKTAEKVARRFMIVNKSNPKI